MAASVTNAAKNAILVLFFRLNAGAPAIPRYGPNYVLMKMYLCNSIIPLVFISDADKPIFRVRLDNGYFV